SRRSAGRRGRERRNAHPHAGGGGRATGAGALAGRAPSRRLRSLARRPASAFPQDLVATEPQSHGDYSQAKVWSSGFSAQRGWSLTVRSSGFSLQGSRTLIEPGTNVLSLCHTNFVKPGTKRHPKAIQK